MNRFRNWKARYNWQVLWERKEEYTFFGGRMNKKNKLFWRKFYFPQRLSLVSLTEEGYLGGNPFL